MAAPDRFENVVRWSLFVATALAFLAGLVLVIWGAVNGRLVPRPSA